MALPRESQLPTPVQSANAVRSDAMADSLVGNALDVEVLSHVITTNIDRGSFLLESMQIHFIVGYLADEIQNS